MAQRGFTLIELLVVLAILAFVSGVVVLNAPPPRAVADAQADAFAARLSAALELSIVRGEVLGIEADGARAQFFYFDKGAWRDAEAIGVSALRFDPRIRVSIDVDDASINNEPAIERRDDDAPAPIIIIEPTGITTALSARFADRRKAVSVELDDQGGLTIVRASSR